MATLEDYGVVNYGLSSGGSGGGFVPTLIGVPGIEAGIDKVGEGFQPTEQTTSSAPWGPQQEYLLDIFGAAQNLYNQGAPLTPGFSPTTQNALAGIEQMAMAGNPLIPGAQNQLMGQIYGGGYNPAMSATNAAMGQIWGNPALGMTANTAAGNFLNANPYLDAMFGRASENVAKQFQNAIVPSITGKFGLAGGYNRPAEQEALGFARQDLGNTLSGLATDIYGGNYARERALMEGAQGRLGGLYNTGIGQQFQGAGLLGNLTGMANADQLQAIGMAPQLNAAGYQDLGQLLGVGQMRDTLAQQQAMDPWTQLGLYQGAVTGNYGGTTTQPGPSAFDTWLGRGSQVANITSPFWLGGPSPTPSPVQYYA